jgi:hypothetical protein
MQQFELIEVKVRNIGIEKFTLLTLGKKKDQSQSKKEVGDAMIISERNLTIFLD